MTTSPTLIADSSIGSPPNPPVWDRQLNHHELPAKLRRYRLGLALYIVSIVMLFVGFSSAYVVRRGMPTYDAATGAYSENWEPLKLPVGLLLVNTLLLIGASVAAEIQRRRSLEHANGHESPKSSKLGWIGLSLALSSAFVAGQGMAWNSLRSAGHFANSGPRIAFFYVLTGAHAFHAILGIGLLAWIALRQRYWIGARRHIVADLAAWYLHSMTVMWVYLFCFLLFT